MEQQLIMERLIPIKKDAKALILKYAIAAAVLSVITGPIPGTSLLLVLLEVRMFFSVGSKFGIGASIWSMLGAKGGLYVIGLASKMIAKELVDLIPILGWFVIKPIIAFGVCYWLGTLAIGHFEEEWTLKQNQGKK